MDFKCKTIFQKKVVFEIFQIQNFYGRICKKALQGDITKCKVDFKGVFAKNYSVCEPNPNRICN